MLVKSVGLTRNSISVGTTNLTPAGLLSTWGNGANGQLGQGNFITRSSPAQVGAASWAVASSGFSHTVALQSNGTLWTWGNNTLGQLGTSFNNPIHSWTLVSLGIQNVLAIRSNGTLWSWGRNHVGQLGDGTILHRSSPVQIGSETWTKAATGYAFALAIKSDGSLWAWGENTAGQLGNSSVLHRSSPVQIGTSSWSQVAVGSSSAYGITADGRLFGWGSNTVGQLGRDLYKSWRAVSTGNRHMLAIDSDYKLWGWGGNFNGEIGDGVVIHRSSPVQIGTSSWIAVAAGQYMSAGVLADGKLMTWGNNAIGALGSGTLVHRSAPAQILSGTSFTQVAAGNNTIYAITTAGNVWACGFNTSGQLGDGSNINRSTPVSWGTNNVAKVVTGVNWVAYRTTAGTIFGAGANTSGQLGDGSLVNRSSRVQIGVDTDWTDISARSGGWTAVKSNGTLWGAGVRIGNGTTTTYSTPTQVDANTDWASVPGPGGMGDAMMAKKTNGTAWVWGLNSYGELGFNHRTAVNSPTQLTVFGENPKEFASGTLQAVYLGPNNEAVPQGFNTLGQLGDNTVVGRSAPIALGRLTSWSSPVQIGLGHSWIAIGAAGSSSNPGGAHAIRADGTLWGWGTNTHGQVGDNTIIHRSSPVQVSGSWSFLARGAAIYSVAGNFTHAIKPDGTLWGWGTNTLGYVGDGTTLHRSSPVQIGTANNWTSIGGGGGSILALKSDGTLWSWGNNYSGQLGDNTILHRSSPVQIAGSWTSVPYGNFTEYNGMAIRSDGTLWAWGTNTNGQLAQNNLIHRSSPVVIGGLPAVNVESPVQIGTSYWKKVAAGGNSSYGITSNNKLFSWGENTLGQLGQNNLIHRSSPVQVTGGGNWLSVSAGDSHAGAIKSDSSLWTWGANTNFRLGHGNQVHRSSPVQVPGRKVWKSLAAGTAHNLAIDRDNQLWGWGDNIAGAVGNVVTVTDSWVQVRSSENGNNSNVATLAIRNDGALFAWGNNAAGVLGQSDLVHRSSPVQIGASSWTQVSIGTNATFALAIDAVGRLFAWGLNGSGQLGLSDQVHRSSPVQVMSGRSFTQVSTGFNHSAAIDSTGKLWSWGQNDFGALGVSDAIHRSSPIQVGTENWSRISLNENYTLAIRSDGKLFGWGYSNPTRMRLADAAQPTLSFTQMAAGYQTHFAISNGALYAWGDNTHGVLGVNDQVHRSSPTIIGAVPATAAQSWVQVVATKSTTAGGSVLARKADGSLWAWGRNTNYHLGTADNLHRSSPVKVGTSSWIAMGINDFVATAIRSDGRLYSWGSNSAFQFGDESYTSDVISGAPTPVGGKFWKSISVGPAHTVAIDNVDELYGWGRNNEGQLGNLTNDVYSWSQISSGRTHHLAIRSDGKLYSWGNNTLGQLGLKDILHRSSPVQVGANSNWSKVAAGQSFSLALDTSGRLFSWGHNTSGQLGDSTIIHRSSPVQVGTSSWTAIAAGDSHVVAIRNNNTLWTWGANDANAKLGDGTTAHRSSPVQVGTSSWSQVAAGVGYSAAIKPDGTLWTWGSDSFGRLGHGNTLRPGFSWTQVVNRGNQGFGIRNDGILFGWVTDTNAFGQLGDNTAGVGRSTFVQIGTSSWSQVSIGSNFVAAIRSDGRLFTWGSNSGGQLGDNSIINRSSPVQIGTSSWSQVSAGSGHALGITTDGKLFAWGFNTYGPLGLNDQLHRSSPVQIGTSSWSQVSAGVSHSMAIDITGRLFTWGDNTNWGMLGLNDVVHRSSPVQVGTSTWSKAKFNLDVTGRFAVGIRTDGTLWSWGLNQFGQLGQGNLIHRSSPVQIGTDTDWSEISLGAEHVLAYKTNKQLYAWGTNTQGQLADWESRVPYSWKQISVGHNHILAIRGDDTLWSWGYNFSGQLGDNTLINRSSPVQIGTNSWTLVSAGAISSAAIRADGTLWVWGSNAVGQIGDNTLIHRSSPVQIGTSSWTQVAVGLSHVLAIDAVGRLFAWGSNFQGGLGDNTILHRSSPVQIGTSSWTQVHATVDGTGTVVQISRAIRADGTLWSWGTNTDGSLGDVTILHRSSPVQVSGGGSWIAVGGHRATLGVKADGTLWGWGFNANQQLADGTVLHRSAPVQITRTNGWSKIGGQGLSTSAALKSDGSMWTWGGNTNFTLGIPGVLSSETISRPMRIGAGHSWTNLAINQIVGVATRNDGVIVGWGTTTLNANLFGNLSTNNTLILPNPDVNHPIADVSYRSSPTLVGTTSEGWTKISAGTSNSYAIGADGTLEMWGSGLANTLNAARVTNSPVAVNAYWSYTNSTASSPVQVGTESTWTQISLGQNNTAGVKSDGSLWTWGSAANGHLGSGNVFEDRSSPVQIGTDRSWTQVSVGWSHTLARDTNSKILGWGFNIGGRIGDNVAEHRSVPTLISSASWTAISAGDLASMAIRSDGALWNWGLATDGLLGRSDVVHRSGPVQIGGDYQYTVRTPKKIATGTWASAGAGGSHTVAVRLSDRSLWSTGYNFEGQLGLNDTTHRSSFVQVGTSSWSQIDAGFRTMLATDINSRLFAWGSNGQGGIGDNTILGRSSPVQIGTSSWTVISVGGVNASTMAIRSDNLLFAWGRGTEGQLGQNNTIHRSSPVMVAGLSYLLAPQSPVQIGNSSWTAVAAGEHHALAVDAAGRLFAWGVNTNGQLGINDILHRSSPVQVGTSTWTAVDLGRSHSVALRSGGSVFVWGSNSDGALGTNETIAINRSSPVQVGTSSWTAVAAHGAGNYAIKPDGTLFAWGRGTEGQIGDGATVGRSSPVQVGGQFVLSAISPLRIGTNSWSMASAGGSHSVAVRSDGTLWAWGLNTTGQVGDNTILHRSSPVQVGTSTWTQVSANLSTTVAVRSDGTLWAWGNNGVGQVGDNTILHRSSPVQIGTAGSWIIVSGDGSHNGAIRY